MDELKVSRVSLAGWYVSGVMLNFDACLMVASFSNAGPEGLVDLMGLAAAVWEAEED